MPGFTLTTDATLMCPHGGQVQIVPSQTKVAAGASVTVESDTMTIVGCQFNISGAPSPCIEVRWIAADSRVTANGVPTLSMGSAGLCLAAGGIPQGSVVVLSSQSKVESV